MSKDDGGVHDNSGIPNHFFYLLCEGGKGWNGEKALVNDGVPYDDFEGIGVELAARIAYQTLTAYCGPSTDYCEVRAYWLDAAIDVIEEGKPNGEPWDEDDIARLATTRRISTSPRRRCRSLRRARRNPRPTRTTSTSNCPRMQYPASIAWSGSCYSPPGLSEDGEIWYNIKQNIEMPRS